MSIPETVVFTDKTRPPLQQELDQKLQDKTALLQYLLRENGIDGILWKYYGKKSGWTMQCRRRNRNLFYVLPVPRGMQLWFVLGTRAKEMAMDSNLSHQTKTAILNAKAYAEGSSFQITIRQESDLTDIKTLVNIKTSPE